MYSTVNSFTGVIFSRNIPEARKVGGKYVRLSKLKKLLIALRDKFKRNGTKCILLVSELAVA